MNNTANKKDAFYIIVLILTFLTVIVGATFALYTFIFSQEEGTSAVYTGTLSIEYKSGEIISFHLLYPTEKPTFETEKNVYKNTFKVTNTGSLDSVLKIVIELKENTFSDEILRYSLYQGAENEIAEGYVQGTDLALIGQNIILEHESSAEYTLIIWMEENGENQNHEMKKRLTGLIRVDAAQKLN